MPNINATLVESNINVSIDYVHSATDISPMYQSFISGTSLSAHKMVYVADDGMVYYANNNTLEAQRVVGMTTHSSLQGDNNKVQLLGRITHTGWGLSIGKYYLGNNGDITNVAPVSGVSLVIGTSTSSDALSIDIKIPIILGD